MLSYGFPEMPVAVEIVLLVLVDRAIAEDRIPVFLQMMP
jgi:hypothetical protein